MKTLFKRMFVAYFLVGGGLTMACAQQVSSLPTDPDVRIGKLENGLTYYIRHNELPAKQAEFYIAQKVGSILEEDQQRGLAHFLEHMCFNGTKHFPDNTLREYLESIGVKFGTNLNAYTSIDQTVYNISNVPVIRDGIIDSCLLILHDWADDLTLDPKEIDKERGVIHEEWRTRTGAMMRMYESAFPKMFSGSKYAYRLPIGTMEVVDNFPYKDLRDYYEKWYRPDLQGIIVVGDINVDQVEAKIKKLFSPIKMPKDAAKREYFPVPDNKETIVTISKDKEQQGSRVFVFHKHEPYPAHLKNTAGYLVYNFLVSAASNMLDTRLAELALAANPPFIAAGTGEEDFIMAKTKKAFTGTVICKEDGIESGLAAMMREFERAQKYGFTSGEFERVKTEYQSQLEKAYNERNKMKNSSFVNQYVDNFLDGSPIPSVEQECAILTKLIPMLKVEQVNEVFHSLVSDSNMVVSLFLPDKEGMKYPTEAGIQKVLSDVQAEKLEPYVDKVSNEPLLKDEPAGGKIVKTATGAYGSKVLTLSNGVRVVLYPTTFKADEIKMTSFSKGGNSVYDDSETLQFSLIDRMAALGGLGNFSAMDLSKVLAGKMASASTAVYTLSESVSGSCAPKDFETMMQLTYLRFTAPRMDQEAFESYKSRMRAQMANMKSNPEIALMDSIMYTMYGNVPRANRMKPEMVDKIDYQRIMDMYKDRFKDASDFTFFLVGNIDEDKMTPLIEKYLGGLPSINRKENFNKKASLPIRKGEYRNVFHRDLQTKKASVYLIYSGKCKYDLKTQYMMNVLSQLLTMEYTETVREQEGASYGVSVSGDIKRYPTPQGSVQIVFDTDPDRRAKMAQLIDKGINDFIANGPKAENLSKVKEYMLKNYESSQKENGFWMNALYNYYWEGTDNATGLDKLINSITAADLQKFAKQFFAQKNRIEVSMTSGSVE